MNSNPIQDPALAELEAGLRALYQGRWNEAEKRLTAVLSQDASPELASRARQWLTVARSKAEAARPEVEDPYLRALYLKNQGDVAAALELLKKRQDSDERCLYLTASLHAALAQSEEAARWLQRAIAANPSNRVHAFHDPDFRELRRHPHLAPLFGLD